MRAKEFIREYAIVNKPDFTKVSKQCSDCYGTGNVDRDGSNQTCPTCSGSGSQNDIQSNYASDKDYQMNKPDTLWAVGKF